MYYGFQSMNTNMTKKTIDFLIPVYNEEENIDFLVEKLDEFSKKYIDKIYIRYLFVDDGSQDATYDKLIDLRKNNNKVQVIKLSRNFGKENALTAGLDHIESDACIIFDADLQDPLSAASEMIIKWEEGFDSIVGKRIDRSEDTFLKKFTASIFYKFHNFISEEKIPENVGDFRLISKRVIESIRSLKEKNRFMKGILPWVGYDTYVVEYYRDKRNAGKTKFNYSQLFSLAREGITSFSVFPLRISQFLGLIGILISFILSIYVIIEAIIADTPDGIPIVILLILLFGSLNLLSLGIIGEYVGKNYIESKNRPIYIIAEKNINKE